MAPHFPHQISACSAVGILMISLFLTAIYAYGGMCGKTLKVVSGTALSLIPFWPSFKASKIFEDVKAQSQNNVVLYKLGYRRHIVIFKNEVYVIKPFREEFTRGAQYTAARRVMNLHPRSQINEN